MGERDRLELERRVFDQQRTPRNGVRQDIRFTPDVGDVDDRAQRRQLLAHRGDLSAPVDELVAEAVAGDGQQDRR